MMLMGCGDKCLGGSVADVSVQGLLVLASDDSDSVRSRW